MEKNSTLLAICARNSLVTGEFPAQRPVTRSFNVFFDLRLNGRFSKQSRGWWFETPSRPLWRQSNYQAQCWLLTDNDISHGIFSKYSVGLIYIFYEQTSALKMVAKTKYDDVMTWIRFQNHWPFVKGIHRVSEWLGLTAFWDSGHKGPCSPYKPYNYNPYIGIIIVPYINSTQTTGYN